MEEDLFEPHDSYRNRGRMQRSIPKDPPVKIDRSSLQPTLREVALRAKEDFDRAEQRKAEAEERRRLSWTYRLASWLRSFWEKLLGR